jgi:Membrane-associated phospholipid phosphatase
MNSNIRTRPPKSFSRKARQHLVIFLHYHHHLARFLVIAVCLLFFLEILPSFIRTTLFRGLTAHPYLTGMLVIFGLIALSLLWSAGQHIDASIFFYFNFRGKRPLWLDRLMLVFTQLGNGLTSLITALILFFLDNRRPAYEIILGTLTLWLIVELVKSIVHRSRPYIKLTQTRIVGPRAHGRSFPSGHTSQSFFMATLLIQYFRISSPVAILLYLLAILVAITRMYVGAHYPRDVMAGAILGSVWGFLGVIVDMHFRI